MLAGANVVLMGAGIPLAIPGVLDQMARWEPTQMKIQVDGDSVQPSHTCHFDPREYCTGELPLLSRPDFYAIVSSDIIAKTLSRKASGEIDGFVVEYHGAGGHNAPPRRSRGQAAAGQELSYGPMDLPDIEKIRELGKPFWLAGGYASPEALKEALSLGANGIQVGTAFALCNESGLIPEIRQRILRSQLDGGLDIQTDFAASPTGYPFKVARLIPQPADVAAAAERCRVCDLGYLRRPYNTPEGEVSYRCPGEPVAVFLKKGGEHGETVGRQCLCNGLLAAAGLAQTRCGVVEPPILTIGENLAFVPHMVRNGNLSYSASDVIDYLES
jgi:NAD(P)H-dependent flavin oxidoreductase YrpB (nitropropane dioxygenase family)